MRKRKGLLTAAAVCAAAGIFALGVVRFAEELELTRHTVSSSKLTAAFRAVLIADVHNSEFPKENARLLETIAEQRPDMILVAGDVVNRNEARLDIAQTLLEQLVQIAPVYVSYGNHEQNHEETFGSDIRQAYARSGAVVLERAYQDIEIGGQAIRLGGIYGYCLPEPEMITDDAKIEEYRFLNDFQDTEAFTLLMCHMPVSWMAYGSLDAWEIDCVFAGHTHGGQIILPFVGGVYAPDQGWFPGRVHGVFESQDSTLIVTRGLGSSMPIPRLGNPPEIVVVDFLPGAAEQEREGNIG